LRRFDFEDQRLIGSEFPATDDRSVFGGRSHRGAVDRGKKAVDRRRPAELEKELQVVVNKVAERDELTRRKGIRTDGGRFADDGFTEPLDSQRGRNLGVPVVKEVAHCQSGMIAFDPHPVPGALLGREDHLEVAIRVHLEFVD